MKTQRSFWIVLALSVLAQPVFAQQDEALFRRHIASSGWHGLFYGIALNLILETEDAAAAGIPIITAGASSVVPLLTIRSISNNSMILANHGKHLGWAHGFAIPSLILGEDAWTENIYKITIASGVLGSIALGRLGYVKGRDKDWPEGLAALFSHYGWVMPFTGLSLGLAFADDIRLGAGLVLASGVGGYLLANTVFQLNPYTRGDIRSIQILSTLSAGFATGLMLDVFAQSDYDYGLKLTGSDFLIPAMGMLAGSAFGHLWLSDARLTPRQANITAYGAGGGALFGWGVAMLLGYDEIWPYYTFSYAFGMGAFAFAVERFRRENRTLEIMHKDDQSKLNIAFMPQNLLINQKLSENGLPSPGQTMRLQPLFSATLNF